MLKQKSRVYQRYTGIVGDNELPLQSVTEITEGQPKLKNQCLCRIKPIPSPPLVPVLVLMGILSLATFVVFPILSVILTDVPYRFAFWYPAQVILLIWVWIINDNCSDLICPYMACYYVPLWLFYMFGGLQFGGIIDWSWIRLCVPLYPMVVLVPASFLIKKHLHRLSRVIP